jgi:predicted N-formylglutamate amidohydrolase
VPSIEPPLYALITCEHASRAIPRRWRALFAGHEALLASHRGWDPGTAVLGRELARSLGAVLLAGRASRLLIDLNRSAGHPARFSEFTRPLPKAERDRIERTCWQPHWDAYRRLISECPGRVTHIACHSFTPRLDGRPRPFEVGLLYDPSRGLERRLSLQLAEEISARCPTFRVRMNAPYRGTANGLGQQHRKLWSQDRLVTIELEVNQSLVGRRDWPATRECLVAAVSAALTT